MSAAGKRVAELIQSAGAQDEDDLHRRAAIVGEARQLDRQRELLGEEIATALAGCEAPPLVAGHLDSGEDLRRLAEETTSAKHGLRAKLGHAWEERGALRSSSKRLRRIAGWPTSDWNWPQSISNCAKPSSTGTCSAPCATALESVRAVFERDRQPEVLREASTYLAELTAGRYRRIWTTLGGRALSVDDADGNALAVDVLSRGTREQIFLSLRLALVSAYARRGIRLPVVMDDVLVNFDVTRAKAAARVLSEFARSGHQLLVFTCHEHLARLFHAAQVEVRTLPGSSIQWDEPAKERPRAASSVPAPHFLPEPVPSPLIVEEEYPAAPSPPTELEITAIEEPPPPAPAPRERSRGAMIMRLGLGEPSPLRHRGQPLQRNLAHIVRRRSRAFPGRPRSSKASWSTG